MPPACTADTSALAALSSIGALDLIQVKFDEVLIVPTVYREVVTQGVGWTQVSQLQREIDAETWVRRCAAASTDFEDELRKRLGGAGEAEAIAVAALRRIPIFLDELQGRKAAANAAIPVIGSLGILREAKTAGQIAKIRPLVMSIMAEGIYYDPNLVRRFLSEMGEG